MHAIGQILENPFRDRTAVDPHHMPGDVSGRRTVQEREHTGLFVGVGVPAQRIAERIQEALPVGAPELVENRGIGDTGALQLMRIPLRPNAATYRMP